MSEQREKCRLTGWQKRQEDGPQGVRNARLPSVDFGLAAGSLGLAAFEKVEVAAGVGLLDVL